MSADLSSTNKKEGSKTGPLLAFESSESIQASMNRKLKFYIV
jgi:hypothetical protein